MNRFYEFRKSYETAIDEINEIFKPREPYERDWQHLMKWLLETEHGAFRIFSNETYAGMMGTAEGFATLSSTLHHALCDDGDVCFPIVNGSPRISLLSAWEDDQRLFMFESERNLLEMESWLGDRFRQNLKVEFCGNAIEFTERFDAVEHARKSPCPKP